ncbi:MAG: cytochrome c oxidase subunit 3 [Pyrinomonadaceae bacterium]|jgi:cytochrome c oxidase subunit 3|nr:cytochrome c oxidase subunit 3 [Pyrinomonadaceae bacterium]
MFLTMFFNISNILSFSPSNKDKNGNEWDSTIYIPTEVVNKFSKLHTRHFYHIVSRSAWPIVVSTNILSIVIGFVTYLWIPGEGFWLFLFSFICLLFSLYGWFRDIIIESTFCGHHTLQVQRGLSLGFVLFLISEVMFFFGFFWAYFHSSLSPAIQIGCQWPPVFIQTFDPWGIPFLNTIILLTSGAAVTWSHNNITIPRSAIARLNAINGMTIAIVFGIWFTSVQLYEYINAPFGINDSVYGSCFYLLTGFHGFHVLVGTIFLIVQYHRLILHHFSTGHHLGYLFSLWYWHFVDVIWLFVFTFVYWWGSQLS